MSDDFEQSVQAKAKELLDHFAALNERTNATRKIASPPEVGIIFVYEGRLLLDTTPLTEAEDFNDNKNLHFKAHARGHDAFWRQLQRFELVPKDVEYDAVPRGRVVFDVKTGKFNIFLDKCIMKDQRMVDKIENEMNLPSSKTNPPVLDSHYKCPGCKPKKSPAQLKQEEEDWDF